MRRLSSVDLEAAYVVDSDLIVVSSSGADSALAQLSSLRNIAPTIVLDYGGQTWQSLAKQLGEATGLEDQVDASPAQDFVRAQYEHLTQLSAPTTFLLSAGDERVAAFLDDPVLANLPSMKTGQVYGLGENSFRIDLYSATEVIEGIVERFGTGNDNERQRGPSESTSRIQQYRSSIYNWMPA
ncbi:hypothetical protein GCM10027040_29940 [Halomonas shantousis]